MGSSVVEWTGTCISVVPVGCVVSGLVTISSVVISSMNSSVLVGGDVEELEVVV